MNQKAYINRRYLKVAEVDLKIRLIGPVVVLMLKLHHQEEIVLEFNVRLFNHRVDLLPQSAGLVDHHDGHGQCQFDEEPVHQKADREDAG